ncbi:MAG: hypothetical protein WKF41_19320 [Gaiellaceae bacterium]
MARHYVGALILDEDNLAEMARHGVSSNEVEQVTFQSPHHHCESRGEPGSFC